MAKSKKDFDIVNPEVINEQELDTSVNKDDFKFVQADSSIHEQKFVTKPTTFLKDSLKRFTKNKSSVVAAGLLGFLLLLSIFVPIFDTNDVSQSNPNIQKLEPKLFDAGTGFWDGTKKVSGVPTDVSEMPSATTDAEKQEYWWPNPTQYKASGVSKKTFSDIQYTDAISKYGKDGYIKFGYLADEDDEVISFTSYTFADDEQLDITRDIITLDKFDTFDNNKILKNENNKKVEIADNYELSPITLYFEYKDDSNRYVSVSLTDEKTVFNIGTEVEGYTPEASINISEMIAAKVTGKTVFNNARFAIKIRNVKDGKNHCAYIGSLLMSTNDTANEKIQENIESISFDDASICLSQEVSAKNKAYWSTTGTAISDIILSKTIYCSFVYDSYEAELGKKTSYNFKKTDLEDYKAKGWITYTGLIAVYNEDTHQYEISAAFYPSFKIKDKEHCPLTETPEIYFPDPENSPTFYIKATYYQYKVLGWTSMPKFLFGTDATGRDLLKYVFEGLRTSLILGILTFIVCFSFGLVYGAISGYYGGNVDLVMERITDILSGIPWIVCMTLFIKKLGQNFTTFALALCFTGWIGTAATTRTQFYRFRGREYVLASRTLGASNARLIFKHILPNSLGTIITGAVLMIPSVIFSEATISYLGLGLQGMSSLGVILSNNQHYLEDYPYMLIFPAVIIALVMISFNLFGNGLRDAINPSLKGEEQ